MYKTHGYECELLVSFSRLLRHENFPRPQSGQARYSGIAVVLFLVLTPILTPGTTQTGYYQYQCTKFIAQNTTTITLPHSREKKTTRQSQ